MGYAVKQDGARLPMLLPRAVALGKANPRVHVMTSSKAGTGGAADGRLVQLAQIQILYYSTTIVRTSPMGCLDFHCFIMP